MTDFEKLHVIMGELDALRAVGRLTFPDFRRLYIAADEAGGGEFLEAFFPFTKGNAAWAEWIFAYHQQQAASSAA